MYWTRANLVWLLLAGLLILCPAQAWAVGPFSHLTYAQKAWPQVAAKLKFSQDNPDLRAAWYAGNLAPDAGYYPGAEPNLARAAHLQEPWKFCGTMLRLSQGDQEKAFAAGWTAHLLLDALTHAKLVNPLSGSAFSQDRLTHKRIEWGIDAAFLAQPQGKWLWSPDVRSGMGLNLWQRALKDQYGKKVERIVLQLAMKNEMSEVDRLPYVWWLGGRLQRPQRTVWNWTGKALGATIRPAYLAWLKFSDGDMNVIAVLSPRQAQPGDLSQLASLMDASQKELLSVLAGGTWPSGTPDADPQGRHSPEAKEVKAWLAAKP